MEHWSLLHYGECQANMPPPPRAFSWNWQAIEQSFSLPWRKRLSVVGSHRRAKVTNLFGSCFLPGSLLINRGTECFPKDRKVSLVIMPKEVNRNRNLSKVSSCLVIRDKLLDVKKSLKGSWVHPITKATIPLITTGFTNWPSSVCQVLRQACDMPQVFAYWQYIYDAGLTKLIWRKRKLRLRWLSN